MVEEHTEDVPGREVESLTGVWGFVDREASLTSKHIAPFITSGMPMDFPTTLSIDEDV